MLDRIRLAWFRNHRNTALSGARAFNLLLGENGAGKTNVLEAISLFAPGRGLRRAALPEMAGQGGDGSFAVAADLVLPGGEPCASAPAPAPTSRAAASCASTARTRPPSRWASTSRSSG
jgi:DNA replication and repair protein RecF